jgi:hypothetical protein
MTWETLEEVFAGRSKATEVATELQVLRARLTAEEWSWLSERQEVLTAYRLALATGRERAAGRVPVSYASHCVCRGCGPVPIWPGAPAYVLGCPWCHVRAGGGDA